MIKRKIIMCVCENNNNSSKCKKSVYLYLLNTFQFILRLNAVLLMNILSRWSPRHIEEFICFNSIKFRIKKSCYIFIIE